MQIQFVETRPEGDYALILVAQGPDDDRLDSLTGDAAAARKALERQRFEGKKGTAAETFLAGEEGRRLLVVGRGKGKGEDAEAAGARVAARLMTSGEEHAVIDLSGSDFDDEAGARLALGAAMRAWRYDKHRTRLKDKQKVSLATVTIVGADKGAETLWNERYKAVYEGTSLTRQLVAEAPNLLYPETFVEVVKDYNKGNGLEIEVLGQKEMEALGMGALLGVAQGSVKEPKLLVMKWMGGKKGEKPAVFIGKGVTFDTGGISLKPGPGMDMMKWDMGGAGAVAGAMHTLAQRKAKANVIGVCGLVENMPDGNAQRPGDIVTTMSGQTVEVLNTDAEGRLVLCDAITWVQRNLDPKCMIDLATLTGAMVITFGHEYAGIFSNNDDLAEDLLDAGKDTGDLLWRQPLSEAYDRLIDSPIADMKNIGPREAGSITAAQFLQRFVENDTPWAHLDIAGMAWSDKDKTTFGKGATGYGVRLLDEYVAEEIED